MLKKEQGTEVDVEVKVDVSKIVKYCCIAAVVIVGIIFGAKLLSKWFEEQKRD